MASPTLLQLGMWNQLTDQLVPHPAAVTGTILNLNDGGVLSLLDTSSDGLGTGLDWGKVVPSVFTAGNPRTMGRQVVRRVYEANRMVKIHLIRLPSSPISWTTWDTTIQNLSKLCEGIGPTSLPGKNPAALQFQPTGSSTPLYFDVLEMHPTAGYQ